MKIKTREEWLESAVELITPLFESVGYKVPKVRVACGWPSARGLSKKRRVLGECWAKDASTDNVAQIFITPGIVDPVESYGVLPVLVHEVAHAVVGHKEGHNKVFGKCARALGLEGKLTATFAGEGLLEKCKTIVTKLGDYPHAQLNPLKRPVKKQTTRLIKCECSECGYVCRTTKKWLDEAGAPLCPTHKKSLTPDLAEDVGGESEGDE